MGFHDRQYCEAPFVLDGIIGKVETWICKRCGYKNPNGVFIRDGEGITEEKKLWAEVESMKRWK